MWPVPPTRASSTNPTPARAQARNGAHGRPPEVAKMWLGGYLDWGRIGGAATGAARWMGGPNNIARTATVGEGGRRVAPRVAAMVAALI